MSSALNKIFDVDGPLAEQLPGYVPRPQQVRAAECIEQTASNIGQVALIEAATGVGKTMAYLLPTLQLAASDRKVIVSTHTLALQSQLWERDIPMAIKVAGRPVKTALFKGRGNYLCLQDFDSARSDIWAANDNQFIQISDWSKQTQTGDVAELDFAYPHWSDIGANIDSCKSQQCRFFDKCFYYKARRLANEADLVLVNHALFFADLLQRRVDPAAKLLPDYAFVVFDEAHHLEDAAAKAFSVTFSSSSLPFFLMRVRRAGSRLEIDEERLRTLERQGEALFEPFFQSSRPEFFVEDVLGHRMEAARQQVQYILDTLNLVAAELAQMDPSDDPALRDRVDGLARRCVRTKEELQALFFNEDDNYVRWGTLTQSGSRAPIVSLYWTPVTVGAVLHENLWKEPRTTGAALVSATLATNGGFQFLKQRLGISLETNGQGDKYPDEEFISDYDAREAGPQKPEPTELELVVGSPFDYPKNCLIYIPRHFPAPSDTQEYFDALMNEITDLVGMAGGGAFLLFTSHRMLRRAATRFEEIGIDYPLLRQGDMPNGKLVQAFREAGNAVLLGTQSFWEGVDVPGQGLRLVVIDRLPFAVPDSPLNKARVDAVTAAGGDWFRDLALPQAQLKLKQGFGRLIRSTSDRGVVAVLDSRLATKYYGAGFLRQLPPARRTFRAADVASFFGR